LVAPRQAAEAEECNIKAAVGSFFYTKTPLYYHYGNGEKDDMQVKGVVLAGGQSSRMNFNKAFANIGGKSSLQIILDKFHKIFAETIIITNDPELYAGYTQRIETDLFPRRGPVAGIHAGLYYASYDTVFVMGCDMPFIDTSLIAYLVDQLGKYQAAVPEIEGCLQPLAAVYSRSCLPVFEYHLQNDKLKLIRIIEEELDIRVVKEEELAQFGQVKEIFLNVNDAAALQKAQQIARRLL